MSMTISDDSALLQEILASVLPQIVSLIRGSKSLNLALLAHDGTIRWANQALAESLAADAATLSGLNIRSYLTAANADLLSRYLTGIEALPDDEFILNMVSGGGRPPVSLLCRLIHTDDYVLFTGELPPDVDRLLHEELLQLNNQLVVLSRENTRKGRELAGMLDDLKKTQAMLVHHEKMASLGRVTAGIAHEINNPIAFMLNNEQVLKRDFDDLLTFITTLGERLPELADVSPRLHDAIVDKAAEIDLEYLMEAAPRKITANIEGLERVKEIILDLRTFSRLDEAERKFCSLSSGIEAALRFLVPLLQEHGVTVETVFAELPEVLCSPGPLNQAISNILINAIQASHAGQSVRVATHGDEAWYCIEVADQGDGIPPEHLGKVFDPFFTTKPVGAGVGLGLNIAHQVIEAHKGRIEIDSSPGAGTTVRILLPRDT